MSALATSSRHCTGRFCQGNQTRKSNKRHAYWKEKNKISLFADDMILYIENSKEFTKKNKSIRTNKRVLQGCKIEDPYTNISCISTVAMNKVKK